MVLKIKAIIEEAIPESVAYVMDPNQDGQHFQAIVISDKFEGLPLVKQHQLVMNCLSSAFQESVHALALKTFTPRKWDSEQHRYL